jgi:hypothetical protein
MKTSLCILALAFFGVFPPSAQAVVVGYEFTGVVTGITGDPSLLPEPGFGGLDVDDTVRGSFTFDLDTPEVPDGDYLTITQEIEVGTRTYTTTFPDILLQSISIDAIFADRWVYFVIQEIFEPARDGQVTISFADFTPPILHALDDSLRPPPAIADVDFAVGSVSFYYGSELQYTFLDFDLTSVRPIPAPGTAALLLLGTLALVATNKPRPPSAVAVKDR